MNNICVFNCTLLYPPFSILIFKDYFTISVPLEKLKKIRIKDIILLCHHSLQYDMQAIHYTEINKTKIESCIIKLGENIFIKSI